MTTPEVIVAVVGTGTEVGKTYVGAALAVALGSRGQRVAARKPMQSNTAGEATDADVLAAATGEQPHEVCDPGRSFDVPLAPPMAAAELALTVPNTAQLAASVTASWGAGIAVGIVEPAGGLRSPFCSDGDSLDFVVAIEPDHVVLVADAELGTINATMLSLDALLSSGLKQRTVVYLNRYDPEVRLHQLNREHLDRASGCVVVTDVSGLTGLGSLER